MCSGRDVQVLAALGGNATRLSGPTDAPRIHANPIPSRGTGSGPRMIHDSTMEKSAILWAVPRMSIERARPPPGRPPRTKE